MHKLLEASKPKFEKTIEFLKGELATIRTGRATPALVEDINVEVYGAIQPIKGLGSINIPDSKTIVIEPWDKGVIKDIEAALRKADIGVNPVVDGTVIRLVMPEMTEENRREMVKRVKDKLEETRVSIRGVREETRGKISQMEKDKEITEDEKYKMQEELDKLTKEYNEKVEEVGKKKEEEIMTV